MSSNDHRLIGCNEKDKETLLIFKKGINDSSYAKISTWLTEKDCCAWEGVHCDNITGRVTELHLHDQNLKGEINFSILELEFLSYLDLSDNYFEPSPTTQQNITHITSNLFYLDLSFNYGAHMDNLDWLSPLSSLKYLNLTGIDLHKASNWLQVVNTLPSLLELQLSFCNLKDFINNPSIEYLNLSSLVTLDLSGNNFTSQLPNQFFNLTKDLSYLDIQGSNIHSEIPSSLLNLQNLIYLDLAYNQLQGSIQDGIGQLANIQHLDLQSNMLSGSIPSTIGNLSSLHRDKFLSLIERISDSLYLSNNSMTGDMSNLTLKCEYLYLEHNNFTGGLPNISPKAYEVDLAYNSFSGSIPHSWKNLQELYYINLWSNKLSGEALVQVSNWTQLAFMNLGENEFSGTIPIKMSQYLEVVILRSNQFEGTIPAELFNQSFLFHLDLAHNKLSGSIPKFMYNLTQMKTFHERIFSGTEIELFTKGQYYSYVVKPDRRTIDFSANNLSGEMPLELFQLVQIQTLNLSHNILIGTIPKTIGGMKNIESLDISNNNLCGEIPESMALLNFLEYLNFSYNSFNGKIPIGTQLQCFDALSFIGNPKLCGAPLNNCTTVEENLRLQCHLHRMKKVI
ncbi:hypothetical protein TSUD_131100 [Trifolium subterraneum]|uniref:Leucine-rich repeat-containing N-terminal plant-type domain-containing protein n=1 Tax=Trifolium subterraneum TaxID=3900 RepID=A0A2Z6P2L9_TRISU|nr:hypothetical protein TSUD_131100 [Trifolium subterraneum]